MLKMKRTYFVAFVESGKFDNCFVDVEKKIEGIEMVREMESYISQEKNIPSPKIINFDLMTWDRVPQN